MLATAAGPTATQRRQQCACCAGASRFCQRCRNFECHPRATSCCCCALCSSHACNRRASITQPRPPPLQRPSAPAAAPGLPAAWSCAGAPRDFCQAGGSCAAPPCPDRLCPLRLALRSTAQLAQRAHNAGRPWLGPAILPLPAPEAQHLLQLACTAHAASEAEGQGGQAWLSARAVQRTSQPDCCRLSLEAGQGEGRARDCTANDLHPPMVWIGLDTAACSLPGIITAFMAAANSASRSTKWGSPPCTQQRNSGSVMLSVKAA
jgi:hypothetical protein